MKKMRWVSGGAALLVSAHAIAGWFSSDGSTYEECMEARRDEVKNAAQFNIASNYCRQKHPLPKEAFDPSTAVLVDPVELHLVSINDPANGMARPAISAVSLTQIALDHEGVQYGSGLRSFDFRWYIRADITNRNRFPLAALIVGVTPHGVTQCSWDTRSYAEVYQCDGYAGAGMSGSFKCNIPNSDKRRVGQYCVVGLGHQ